MKNANELKNANGIKKITLKTKEVIKENVISESKKSVSDAELFADLSDVNIESVIKKTALNRSIWTQKAKMKFGKTEKRGRTNLRKKQITLSSAIIRELKLNLISNARSNAKELKKFYNESLVDFSVYSNISEETNKIDYDIVHKAYAKMNLLLK